MLSRFYVCEIKSRGDGANYLALKGVSDKSSIGEQKQRAKMFMEFQKKFNETMSGYCLSADTVDYNKMIDDSFKAEANQSENDKNTEVKTDEE